MSVKFSNNGHSTLASSLSSSATSITVASGHGARFPSLTGSEYFYATLIDSSNNLEIVKVTARSSDVLTVTRAQESTTARAYAIGDRVELRVTAQGLVDIGTPTADSIINSMIATNAVNSDSIAANAVTASELNISGNGTSGQVLLSDGDGSFSYGDISGAVRKLTMFNDATYNINLSSASSSFPITFDFVKDQADSDLFIQGWTPAVGQASYRVGERMRLQKTASSAYDSGSDNEIYGGNQWISPPPGQNLTDQVAGIMHWSRRVNTSSETFFNSAETYRVHLGWSSRDGSGQNPSERWNPQNTSARDRQSTTNVWVWELDPSSTAFVT